MLHLSMLHLRNLRKHYDDQVIINIHDLPLENGIYWLKGPNGSGKTTLLKMIAGIIPFKGEIELNNVNINKSPVQYRRQISWAEAEPLFPAFVTGTELISLYAGINHAPKEQIAELVAGFNMKSYIDSKIGAWSSGMQKKLSITLALLGNPRLVLLDEPLITLDAESIRTLIMLIDTYHSSKGTSFLASSHIEDAGGVLAHYGQLELLNHTLVSLS